MAGSRSGGAWFGKAGCGVAVVDWGGTVRKGQVRRGLVRHAEAGFGAEWPGIGEAVGAWHGQDGQGTTRCGPERCGTAVEAPPGMGRTGEVRHGADRSAQVWLGLVWRLRRGRSWLGRVWRSRKGWAGPGLAWRGMARSR